jgi:hypothetical protein
MNTHEIVNLIVQKFGSNRVKFDLIDEDAVEFVLGHNLYRTEWLRSMSRLAVMRMKSSNAYFDNYSRWVEGILNGMVRNDAGEMVTR